MKCSDCPQRRDYVKIDAINAAIGVEESATITVMERHLWTGTETRKLPGINMMIEISGDAIEVEVPKPQALILIGAIKSLMDTEEDEQGGENGSSSSLRRREA